MVKIKWYPFLRLTEKTFQTQSLAITHFPPEPAFKYFADKYPSAEYIRCPAFSDYLRNTFIIRNPYDLVVTLDKDIKNAFTDRYDQDFYDSNVKATYIDGIFLLHLPPRLLFIPEGNQSVMLTCLPMMIDPNPFSVIAGTFDISKWMRPTEFTIQTHDATQVVLKRGEAVMMVKFTTENNDTVKLEQDIVTQEIINAVDACVKVKNTVPALNLKTLYKIADPYITKVKKLIKKD